MKSWLNEPENLALREPPGWKTLQAFVAVDLALIIVHVVNRATVDYRFPRIDIELGLGEIYQYGKFAVLVAVMVDVSRRSHTWSPLLWSLVFAYLLVDDALGLHEALGAVFGRALDRPPGETSIQILANLTIAAGVAFDRPDRPPHPCAVTARLRDPDRRPGRVRDVCGWGGCAEPARCGHGAALIPRLDGGDRGGRRDAFSQPDGVVHLDDPERPADSQPAVEDERPELAVRPAVSYNLVSGPSRTGSFTVGEQRSRDRVRAPIVEPPPNDVLGEARQLCDPIATKTSPECA